MLSAKLSAALNPDLLTPQNPHKDHAEQACSQKRFPVRWHKGLSLVYLKESRRL